MHFANLADLGDLAARRTAPAPAAAPTSAPPEDPQILPAPQEGREDREGAKVVVLAECLDAW